MHVHTLGVLLLFVGFVAIFTPLACFTFGDTLLLPECWLKKKRKPCRFYAANVRRRVAKTQHTNKIYKTKAKATFLKEDTTKALDHI